MGIKKIIVDKQFERFFFYGIDNKREVKEMILYIASSEVYKKDSGRNWYEIPNEQIESQIIEQAIEKYKHFYRFVVLNDISDNFDININEEELKKELEKEMKLLKQENIVIDTKAGIFFTREREAELLDKRYYVPGEGVKVEKNWTKEIYEILEKLDKIEKEDINKYYKYWLVTKYARANNRQNREEATRVRNMFEDLKREEENENNDKVDLDDLEL